MKAALSDEKIKAINIELALILGSAQFYNKKSLSRLLLYLVNHTVLGDINELSQKSIAMNVLNKSEDFDCIENALVRVQVSRLRKALKLFYTDHTPHKLRISISQRPYLVEFSKEKGKTLNIRPHHSLRDVISATHLLNEGPESEVYATYCSRFK